MDFYEKSSLIPGYLIQGMTQACKNYIKSFVGSKIHVSTIQTGYETISHHFPN
jgi:hypothetical protein